MFTLNTDICQILTLKVKEKAVFSLFFKQIDSSTKKKKKSVVYRKLNDQMWFSFNVFFFMCTMIK